LVGGESGADEGERSNEGRCFRRRTSEIVLCIIRGETRDVLNRALGGKLRKLAE
jgi:hypothetical protein